MKGGFVLALLLAASVAVPAELPGDSLYQLQLDLAAPGGASRSLASLRGRPVLISMFYASCNGVCPAIAFTMRRMLLKLTPAGRAALQPVLVTFDPAHDDDAALTAFAMDNKLDAAQWLVARTSDAGTRSLATALDVRYRPLPNGAYSHSTTIVLLDADGVIRAHTSDLSTLDPEFMRTLALVAGGGSGS